MKLSVLPKGNKFEIFNERDNKIFTVKKKGFGSGKYLLIDKNGYQLYVLTPNLDGKRPKFKITLNEKTIFDIECTSRFVDPTIEFKGNSVNYTIRAIDKDSYEIFNDSISIGSIKVSKQPNDENRFDVEFNEKYYDDYLQFFAICVNLTFIENNR